MIGAIVLAAGASSRMGRNKAELPARLEGRTFLDTIEETLAGAAVTAVRIVVAPGAARRGEQTVVNPDPSEGMLSSVLCGLRAFSEELEAVFVWPVDHPLVQRETIAAMIEAFRKSGPPIVVPAKDGKRGHPVLFAARIFPELLAADPSRGARAVVRAHDDRLELAVDDDGVVLDIDTPEDYARAFGRRTS